MGTLFFIFIRVISGLSSFLVCGFYVVIAGTWLSQTRCPSLHQI